MSLPLLIIKIRIHQRTELCIPKVKAFLSLIIMIYFIMNNVKLLTSVTEQETRIKKKILIVGELMTIDWVRSTGAKYFGFVSDCYCQHKVQMEKNAFSYKIKWNFLFHSVFIFYRQTQTVKQLRHNKRPTLIKT